MKTGKEGRKKAKGEKLYSGEYMNKEPIAENDDNEDVQPMDYIGRLLDIQETIENCEDLLQRIYSLMREKL